MSNHALALSLLTGVLVAVAIGPAGRQMTRSYRRKYDAAALETAVIGPQPNLNRLRHALRINARSEAATSRSRNESPGHHSGGYVKEQFRGTVAIHDGNLVVEQSECPSRKPPEEFFA